MPSLTKQPAAWVEHAPVQVVATKTIAATPSAIWQRIADHETWPEWFGSVDSVEVTGEPTGVGGRRRVIVGKGALVVDEEFTEWTPDEVFAFTVTETNRGGLRSMNERVRLTPTGSGTTVEYRMSLDPKQPLKLLAPIVTRMLRRNLVAALDGLAARVAG